MGQILPGIVIFVLVLGGDQGFSSLTDALGVQGAVASALVAAVLVSLLFGVGSWMSWRKLTYYFDESGDLRVASGVLTRQERRLQLSRLQSVDVEQPLVARLVGLAEVRVEVAGAGDSRVELRFLTESDAQDLRAEVLARAAGLRPDVGQAPERALLRVATGDLALSLLMSSTMVIGVLATALVVVVAVMSAGWTSLFVLLITGGAPLIAVIGEFVRYFDFTVAESPDGLRLRSGLTTKQSQTVPPGRVHAVELVEPFLWRRKGWVRVKVTVAGAPGGDDQLTTGVLVPVATTNVGQALVDRVLAGVSLESLEWTHAPDRSRWRAPWQWRRLGVASDEAVVATRGGRFVRTLQIVPHARVQSMTVMQGPWQRRLDLATVQVDIAPGPITVKAHHLAAESARTSADAEAQMARRARLAAGPERWMAVPPGTAHAGEVAPAAGPPATAASAAPARLDPGLSDSGPPDPGAPDPPLRQQGTPDPEPLTPPSRGPDGPAKSPS